MRHMKWLPFLILAAAIATGCGNSVKDSVMNLKFSEQGADNNWRSVWLTALKSDALSQKEKTLLQGAMLREAQHTPPSILGRTVRQVMDDQREWQKQIRRSEKEPDRQIRSRGTSGSAGVPSTRAVKERPPFDFFFLPHCPLPKMHRRTAPPSEKRSPPPTVRRARRTPVPSTTPCPPRPAMRQDRRRRESPRRSGGFSLERSAVFHCLVIRVHRQRPERDEFMG